MLRGSGVRLSSAVWIVMALLTLSCAATSHGSVTPSPAPSAKPASPPTAPVGPLLVGLWKGYVSSLNKSVFIVWVRPKSSSSDDVSAAIDDTYALIIPKLRATAFSIFIVNTYEESHSGLLNANAERGFIFLRDSNGHWDSLTGSHMSHKDKGAFVDRLLQAGLPHSPDAPGAWRVSSPLGGP